jgi:hypothetical protein
MLARVPAAGASLFAEGSKSKARRPGVRERHLSEAALVAGCILVVVTAELDWNEVGAAVTMERRNDSELRQRVVVVDGEDLRGRTPGMDFLCLLGAIRCEKVVERLVDVLRVEDPPDEVLANLGRAEVIRVHETDGLDPCLLEARDPAEHACALRSGGGDEVPVVPTLIGKVAAERRLKDGTRVEARQPLLDDRRVDDVRDLTAEVAVPVGADPVERVVREGLLRFIVDERGDRLDPEWAQCAFAPDSVSPAKCLDHPVGDLAGEAVSEHAAHVRQRLFEELVGHDRVWVREHDFERSLKRIVDLALPGIPEELAEFIVEVQSVRAEGGADAERLAHRPSRPHQPRCRDEAEVSRHLSPEPAARMNDGASAVGLRKGPAEQAEPTRLAGGLPLQLVRQHVHRGSVLILRGLLERPSETSGIGVEVGDIHQLGQRFLGGGLFEARRVG